MRVAFPRFLPLILLVALLSACRGGPEETEIAGEAQGTTYHIKFVAEPGAIDLEGLKKQVDETFDDIDRKLSNYRQDSEISRLNREKTTEWRSVSAEIAELVAIAKVVHAKSDGCYDLTVKPLFDLWGFSRHAGKVPTAAEIARVLPHLGLNKIELDREGRRLRKLDPDMAIDLSSIAQGYTVGAIAKLLESHNLVDYMAEIGGEMKIRGRKANGSEWRIAVEKPTPFTREVQQILSIHQQNGVAVMTSGTYRNFFEDGGKTYSHILDPRTGRPVAHHLLSTTVLLEDPSWADAWSTALLCMGEELGYRVAEAEGLNALLIYGEDGQLKEKATRAFAGMQ